MSEGEVFEFREQSGKPVRMSEIVDFVAKEALRKVMKYLACDHQ